VNILKEKERTSNIIFIILLSFIFLYFYKLGSPSIWNPNEAFYAETPREMIEKKEFLTPYFNYEYRFEKPVLTYWLVLISYYLFGIKEISVRMVSAISAACGVFITYWLGKTIWNNNRAGLISGLLLATAVDYNSLARYASTDMPMTVLLTFSLVLFYKGYIDKKRQRLWYFLVYIICGFATLTKGPIGIIMPLLVISTFLLIKRDLQGFKDFVMVKGFLAYLLIVLPWYLYMFYTHGNEFFSILYRENFTRFSKKISGLSSPFYYFSVIPWNFFPGSVFIIPTLLWLCRGIRKLENIKFPLVWFLTVFIFFSIARSKLPAYILSSLPALAVIVGGWINASIETEAKGKNALLWLSPVILVSLLSVIFWLKTFLPDINPYLISILFILLLLSLLNIKKRIYYLSFVISLIGVAVFNLIFLSDILPQIEKYRRYKEITGHVKLNDPDKRAPFYCYEGYQHNLSFYLERKILRIQGKDALTKFLEQEKDGFVLLKKKTLEENYKGPAKKIIWKGLYYDRSESIFMRFLMDIKKNKIEEYVIIK
jgi:4-amino-4-deoxy-L-arabinose transferase-like glycosyltransferase